MGNRSWVMRTGRHRPRVRPSPSRIDKKISITIDHSIHRLEEYNSRIDKPSEMSAFGVNIKVFYVH